jgi:hypothetical protein
VIEPHRPLVAPDLEIHVDHVVIGNGETGDVVVEAKGSLLVGGGVVPDDAHQRALVFHAVGSSR